MDVLAYNSGHRHLRDTPQAGMREQVARGMRFMERKRTLKNMGSLAHTFDPRRRDMIFSSQ